MPQPEHHDFLILGSGQGGKLLAWHLARSGQRVAVVERRWVGGSCPAVACLPSKNEIWSARVAHLTHHAAQFGTETGAVVTDMAKVRRRKQDMIDREIAFHLNAYKTSGAELIIGSGRFIAPKMIEVALNDGGKRVLIGSKVVINIGTHAAIPRIPGLEVVRPLTHIEVLELDILPPHLIVLGGGYVGLEMAQAYRRFSSRVTVVEPGPQIVGREDRDIADEMQRLLADEGVGFLIEAEPLNVHGRSGEEVSVTVRTASGSRTPQEWASSGRLWASMEAGLARVWRWRRRQPQFTHVRSMTSASSETIWAAGTAHARPTGTLLHVHGPAACPCRAQRG